MPSPETARRGFAPWVVRSLAVIVASWMVNPLVLYFVLPEATFVGLMTWSYGLWPYGFDLAAMIVLPLLVIAWVMVCAMAFSRVGRRALWLLAGAPLMLVPAFAANTIILGCSLLGQCPGAAP